MASRSRHSQLRTKHDLNLNSTSLELYTRQDCSAARHDEPLAWAGVLQRFINRTHRVTSHQLDLVLRQPRHQTDTKTLRLRQQRPGSLPVHFVTVPQPVFKHPRVARVKPLQEIVTPQTI